MKTEIAQTQTSPVSPSDMISEAIKGGADLEQLEKLMALQERWEAAQAKKAYHKAMAAFKANPPMIDKDKTVAFGNTRYTHATLANVTNKISAELSKHGLSASWGVSQSGGAITVSCRITHEQGHGEQTSLTAPADNSGSKNAIQQIGSTVTYLERYSLLALTGLATEDMEDDGRASGNTEKISEAEANELMVGLTTHKIAVSSFLAYMKVERVSDMLKTDLPKAKIAIQQKANEPGGRA